ncbi:U4/U6 small nuclear ribonucleoprotein Prp31 [Anopheles arabiensis]|uniref:U4/U6 small nuclear ribonucleoprotein Prp31 n=2 Tax=gambiae species complex TaxID=44542 RepID=A0A6E8W7E0_ANOCL|nr:U4/U6 small nuclear ribonucleoprotein Prp31 [Anopheles arabiensis]XP_040237699.2 U4/U6 small nuclear ribonucleoprotein Prp31 [Anopheles coluzzii]XP_061511768.1 U4/U6 small nuclear ribonucleoprotein Prp31 [Anopheles gambiae]
MSLADELLADLEDDNDEEMEEGVDTIKEEPKAPAGDGDEEDADSGGEEDAVIYDLKDEPMEINLAVASIREICKLRDSDRLSNVLSQIEKYAKNPRTTTEMVGNVESDPEYQLIVEANNIAVDIDNEISTIHKFVKDKYQKRFPELDSLIMAEMDYIRSVRELGNDLDQAKNNERLQEIITQATIMIVSVTASTTQGVKLEKHELEQINEACDMAVELNDFKSKIFEYVESRMTFIAPNMSMIVGASTAAKLVGLAGGLTKLSKMPACNVQVLGAQKKTLSGFSKVAMLPHTGYVYYCDIVQDTPPDLRRKAARLVAAKCTLAARVDASHESHLGEIGQRFREDIEKKLDKLQEPPPVKFIKPLPKPIEGGKKKRGGKRVRKMKERYAITEFRKQANRMNFGDIEEDAYQEDLGYTRGTIGKTGTGRIRLPQIDEKTKVRISKTLQKNLQKQQQVWGGSTTVKKHISGTASSVAFTPLQGLEIVNPQAAEKSTSESGAKYFSNTSGFLSVGKKTT